MSALVRPICFLILLALGASVPVGPAEAATFRLDFHHRFSKTVRRWADSMSWRVGEWPEEGTVNYYASLVQYDRALRRSEGRRLVRDRPALTFSEGNATLKIDKLGYLHYAEVSIGTPSLSFLVALDTGSDLFWVPCDCVSCATTSLQNFGVNFKLNTYSPNSSLTSKKVTCNSTLCQSETACSESSGLCRYKVAYISSDTASSGVLVEDVMYLTTEDSRGEPTRARVTFGCGQVQSGSFLDSAAPNGLFGLGLEKISVPSILASSGLISNSFSMCFGLDGIGRISFGDKGSSDQDETPFSIDQLHSPTYVVSVTGLQVGKSSFTEDFLSLVDSGTSFTTLTDPIYTSISESFNSQVHDKRRGPDPQMPFEYCYISSSNQTEIPTVSLKMKGESEFPVTNPIIFFSAPGEATYCLAIVKSRSLNIIGQNFLVGLRVIFDREKLVLGWKKFDCYDTEALSALPVVPQNSSTLLPPNVVVPNSYNPEATKQGNNPKEISVVRPSSSSPLPLRSEESILHGHDLLFLLSVLFL